MPNGAPFAPLEADLWEQIPAVARGPVQAVWDYARAMYWEGQEHRAQRREKSIASCGTCSDLREENDQLRQTVEELKAENAALKEQLNRNSSNSSSPPSSDPPGKRYVKRRKRSGRRPGGQPGHPGHQRPLVPEEQVDEANDCYPEECEWCGHELSRSQTDDGDGPLRHQIAHLPKVRIRVVEYRLHTKRCSRCLQLTGARVPEGVPEGNFSPEVEATVAVLTGCYPLSRRQAVSLMQDLFGLNMSLGVVPTIEKRVTQAVADAVAEAKDSVEQSPVVNNDATGWFQNGKRRYMFISVMPDVVTFDIVPKHNAEVVAQLLGPGFKGFLVSDRHSIYSVVPTDQRQVCLSHVDRDFAKMADRGGESQSVGEAGADLIDLAFKEWHRYKAGEIDRQQLKVQFKPIEKGMQSILKDGAACCSHSTDKPCLHRKTQKTCKNLLEILPAFWTFVHHEGIEPTNNASEQGLRRGVIKRKLSFGAKSQAGNQFVESMMTVAATLTKQGRHILSFLTAALVAALTDEKGPSLMPDKHASHVLRPGRCSPAAPHVKNLAHPPRASPSEGQPRAPGSSPRANMVN